MFRYVIQQLLAKLIFLVVLDKHPARFVPALAPSTRLWRELEHLPLSGTQVKLCLLWGEPRLCWSREQSFPAPGDIAAPLETPKQEQSSPCLPKKISRSRRRSADTVTVVHQAAGVCLQQLGWCPQR